MTNTQSAKDEIKHVADIVQVIGQYVQLKKSGRNFVGLCPFHAEKDPSFSVSPERQIFHCFGCKRGGDVFAFWMAYHSFTFPEALKDLAERYNVPISEGFSPSEEKRKAELRESLFKINETATQYFQEALNHPLRGKSAADYLERRSVSKEITAEFRLGYAPEEWEGMVRYLRGNKIDLNLAVQAGLVIPKEGGRYYDRFRGRIIFPIFNLRDRVVGFGGRVLDDSMPKYLNTPETPIFHKGEFPYGLHASHRAIREKGRSIIVEGYMDFLALRRYGLHEIVATLGTALTGRHVRKIKGYAKEAVVVFDSDEAGKTAALKSLPLFMNEGLPAKAVVLPDGHDPDSYVHSNGLAGFVGLVDKALPMFDFYLDQKLAQRNSGVEGKVQVLKEILPVLVQVRNRAQRSLYIRHLSDRLEIREEVIMSELDTLRRDPSANPLGKGIKVQLTASKVGKAIGDLQLLNLLLHHPETVTGLKDCNFKALVSDPSASKIVDVIFEKYRREGRFSPENLEDSLDNEGDRAWLREILVADSIYSDQEVTQAVREMEAKAYKKKISESLKRAAGDPAAMSELLKLKALGPPRP